LPETIYLIDLSYAYFGIQASFAVAQLLLLQHHNRVHLGLWLTGSLFSAIGVFLYPNVANLPVAGLTIFGPLFTFTAGLLRFLAFSYRKHTFHKSPLARTFVWLSLLALPLIAVPAFTPYRLFMGSGFGLLLSAACFVAVLHNPLWKSRVAVPVAVSLMALGISCLIFLTRAATAYPFGADQSVFGQSGRQRLGFESLILINFLIQLGFTALIVDLRAREDARKDRIAIRITQRTKRLRKRAQEVADAARARLDLVQLLTHEVRQPITNAQASLQAISLKLGSTNNTPTNASFALKSAQSSLDYITLSLSNIIVASTILSDESKWKFHEIDAFSALKLSILDFDKEIQDRIKINSSENSIYFESVSILLRLALQNIIENSIKFSQQNSNIYIYINIDFDREMIVFDIDFLTNNPDLVNQNIFERRLSSDTNRSGISSLGLFVVRQIARELGGSIRLLATLPGRQSFQLALPC